MYTCSEVFKNKGSSPGNSRWKNPAGFHANWDLFPFPCKYRSRSPTQIIPEEILISRSHPHGYCRDLDFPFLSTRFPWKSLFSRGFRSRAVKSRGNIDFPNPVHTKTLHKKVIITGIIPACPACTGSPKGNSAYVFKYLSTRVMSSDRSRVLGVFCILYGYFCIFSFA